MEKIFDYIPGFDYLMQKFGMRVVNEDVALLTGLDKNLKKNGAELFGTLVSSDQPVKRYRKWLKEAEQHADFWFKGWKPASHSTDIEDLAV
jgi:hypothetical protein